MVTVYYGYFDMGHRQIASGMKQMRLTEIIAWLNANPGAMITKIVEH